MWAHRYCFGGSMAIRLGATDVFDSVVIAHPGGPSLGEIQKIKVPAAWVCAEEDMGFKKSLRNEAEAHFASRKGTTAFVEYEFKDYKGTLELVHDRFRPCFDGVCRNMPRLRCTP